MLTVTLATQLLIQVHAVHVKATARNDIRVDGSRLETRVEK